MKITLNTIIKTWLRIKVLSLIICPLALNGQSNTIESAIMNGSFEENILSSDRINCTNSIFDSVVSNCHSIGNYGNIDMIKSNTYCDAVAQDGQWFVSLTGGGTDILSLKLSQPLVQGTIYKVSFYNKFCQLYENIISSTVDIGLSTDAEDFGELIDQTRAPLNNVWLLNTFTFTAPLAGEHLNIKLTTGTAHDTWVQFDNFKLEVGTGVNDFTLNTKISVYPNPSSDNVTVESTEAIDGMKVFDTSGKLLYEVTPEITTNVVEKNISDLTTGIYIIEVQQGDSKIVKKILKSNL